VRGLWTAAVVVLVAACATGGPVAQEEDEAGIVFETVVDEVFSGLDESLRGVVRDAEGWAELWDQIHRKVSPRPPLPPVDFSRDMLIAVAAGTRRSGGFDIGVRRVAVREGQLEVEVFETCPASGARVSMALSQPLEVVRLEKRSPPPVFRHLRSPSCN
jgi:hypothetical protein